MSFSILAIFKNESHVITEWIQHYLNEGADDIILVDNESDDDWQSKISPEFLTSDKIHFYNHAGLNQQRNVYKKYFKLAKNNWVLICDLDEFLYSRKQYATIADYLNSIDNDDITNILIPWKIYGHSGFKKQPEGVVNNFVHTLDYDNTSVAVKSLVRKDRCTHLDLHVSGYNTGCVVDPLLKAIPNHPHMNISGEYIESLPLHINHYVVQSEEWFWNVKVKRGRADCPPGVQVRNQEFFDGHGCGTNLDEELKFKTY